jgi:hypothetical protein
MRTIFLYFFIFPFAIQSQTVQGTDFPMVGMVNKLMLTDSNGVVPGNAGDGVTWDFSSLQSNGLFRVDSFISPASSPYATSFPSATLVDHQSYPGTDYFIYFKDDGSAFQRIGNVHTDTVKYPNPANQFPYPLSFGTSNSDTYFASYYSGGNLAHMSGVINNSVDGRGTLILPNGTYYNVIRMKFTRHEMDTVFMPMPVPGTLDETFYYWYQTQSYYPLLYIQNTNTTVSGYSVNEKYVGYRQGILGIDEQNAIDSKFFCYPNPANESITVRYKLAQVQKLELTLFNLEGIPVFQSSMPSNGRININIERLPNGIYLLRSNTGDVKKVVVEHQNQNF